VFELYQITKLTGIWPNGSIGWANEPFGFVQAYVAFEAEENAIQAEEMAKREAEAKIKGSKGKPRRR
jgi:hypothetical protein